MIQIPKNTLRVEPLKASHFPLLKSSNQKRLLPLLQPLLIKSWIAKAENHIPNLLPARQPLCLIALEDEQPIAFNVIRPYNRRGSCWSIDILEIIENSTINTKKNIQQSLINSSIKLMNNSIKGWILRTPTYDIDQIANARELGFQPLKFFQCWEPTSKILDYNFDKVSFKSFGLEWNSIDKSNAQKLWPLEQGSYSGHLRQIIDRQWVDLLDHKKNNSGVLINKFKDTKIAIAGIIDRTLSVPGNVIEILRDFAWDSRLAASVPLIINKSYKENSQIKIITSLEDDHLGNLLEEIGCCKTNQEVLLGRTLWRRQINNRKIPGTLQIESMLEGFRPQRPPLPSPSLSRR